MFISSPQDTDRIYQTHILQGVSRTFALTIPQLPAGLKEVVGNAYLLCRIADTIEDDTALTVEQKNRFARYFVAVVAEQRDAVEFAQELVPLLGTATLEAERDLIANTPKVIRLTHSFNTAQREALLRCVQIMSAGMARFQRTASRTGLPDLRAMDEYCYFVAGVVGEMLTALFCDYSPSFAAHGKAHLQKLSISFGQGLQMTNILKDIWDDLQRGACWLPRDIFAAKGYDLSELQVGHYDPAFGEGLAQLVGIAREHLHNALRYTMLIPPEETGMRRFCLWALGMAVLTLRRIEKQRDFRCGQDVKISRRSVKATVMLSNLALHNNLLLESLFKLLTRSLPDAATYPVNLHSFSN